MKSEIITIGLKNKIKVLFPECNQPKNRRFTLKEVMRFNASREITEFVLSDLPFYFPESYVIDGLCITDRAEARPYFPNNNFPNNLDSWALTKKPTALCISYLVAPGYRIPHIEEIFIFDEPKDVRIYMDFVQFERDRIRYGLKFNGWCDKRNKKIP